LAILSKDQDLLQSGDLDEWTHVQMDDTIAHSFKYNVE
jgi:hypothetical protein